MLKAAIVGATGYTGMELVRILSVHPDVELTVITSRSRPKTPIADIFPSLKGLTELSTEVFDPDKIAQKADIAFTALPHGSAAATVSSLLKEESGL